jgi:DNA invertase Pin-like site-specific DNA recombinase
MRVASYCRVSTDKEDQANSFASQQRYFQDYIQSQPGWELARIYADSGTTGTSTRKRDAFLRMMADAEEGEFQMILTKEVSRFSRNILDTIAYTRRLRAWGIGVVFLTDGINTLEPDAELRLSIMASLAQEESRRTSQRVKWGQTRQMERGVVFGRSLLGYDVSGGTLRVNPEGAAIVRRIFYAYGVEKKGTTAIARELREAGLRPLSGNAKWSNTHLIRILRNEKYAGDLVQKKTYTPDYLTHAKKYNHGQEELILLKDHHEAIIDRALWETVQRELARRSRRAQGAGHGTRYLFSGKITCGCCGASFVSRRRTGGDGTPYRRWTCRTAATEGRAHGDSQGNRLGCDIGCTLRDDTARDLLRQTLGSLPLDRESVCGDVMALLRRGLTEEGTNPGETARLAQAQEATRKKKEALLDAFLAGDVTREEMQAMKGRYDAQLADLRHRLQAQRDARAGGEAKLSQAEKYVGSLLAGEEESDALWRCLLEGITLFPGGRGEIRLRGMGQCVEFRLVGLGKEREG